MTRFSGYRINATPCCGALFRTRRYLSMNFMAGEYWTDGHRERSLMPNGHGLKKCSCGEYYVQQAMRHLYETDESELRAPLDVPPEELPQAIARARTPDVELAARLDYWQHLNHPYRDLYRAHRKSEEQASQATWESANPDRRSWLEKIRRVPRKPPYKPDPDRPITAPPFQPTLEQRTNMEALLRLLKSGVAQPHYAAEIVELHRQLGQFAEAALSLTELRDEDDVASVRLTAQLIAERATAPMRFRA